MALKPTRISPRGEDSVAYFMAATGERGSIVTWNADTSSGNLDDPNAIVQTPTGQLGVPVGVLMNDVVNLDLTRQHLNQHKDEVQVNGKVTVLKRGTVQTDRVVAGQTPVAGNDAYFNTGGRLTTLTTASGALIGKFASSVDADGYVVVDVRL